MNDATLLEDLIRTWDKFHEHLPDGEYTGLGELRIMMSSIRRHSINCVCRNPNHALVDGSFLEHEIGPSCMPERSAK